MAEKVRRHFFQRDIYIIHRKTFLIVRKRCGKIFKISWWYTITRDFIFNKVCARIMHGSNFNVEYEVHHCLVRTRTYIRLRKLNRKAAGNSRTVGKKMAKITGYKKWTNFDVFYRLCRYITCV